MTTLEYCQAQLVELFGRLDGYRARLDEAATDQEQSEIRKKIRAYEKAIGSVLDQKDFFARNEPQSVCHHREYTISWREE